MSILEKNDDAKRIAELKRYNILDTLTEKDYEDITFLASVICEVPIALISFVDKERQWFKSHMGISISETLREYSFCSHAINTPSEIMVVEDSRIDPRFKDNPLVTGEPNIVFYAGVPLVNDEGYSLGTVCIIDTKKRMLTGQQVKALKVLSDQVMYLLELRKNNDELNRLKLQLESKNKDLEQFAMVVAHDIKSPLATVLVANEMIENDYGTELGEDGARLLTMGNNAVTRIKSLVDGILSYYKGEGNFSGHDEIHLPDFFDGLKTSIPSSRSYRLKYEAVCETLFFNKTQLEQIFFNLVSNSIRYNKNEVAEIEIRVTDEPGYYKISFADNGIGIAAENHSRIFELFATASSSDNLGIKGSGIGLATVKKIIENAGGEISVQSELGTGTKFIFSIKKDAGGSGL